MPQKMDVGVPLPLGAHQQGTGINFSVFSRHATEVSLLLFGDPQDHVPTSTITLHHQSNRTGDIWHLWVEGVGPGSLYAWRVDGPDAPEQGDRFNPHKILLDPYATALVGTDCWDFAYTCREDHADSGEDDAAVKPK
ncbi:MAG: glycogen debranching enzyme, partial [Gammaproteobacteria bacterium]